MDKHGEETGSECDAACLLSPDQTPTICRPASPFSTMNNKESSDTDQFDNKIKTDHSLEIAKEEAFVPQDDPPAGAADDNQNKSRHVTSTPPKLNLQTFQGSKEASCILTNDNDPLRNQIRRLSVNNTEPVKPDPLQRSYIALQDGSQPVQEDAISTPEPKLSSIPDKEFSSEHCVASLFGLLLRKRDTSPTETAENLSEITVTGSDEFLSVTDGPEQQKDENSQTPKKHFSIVLDVEPKNMEENDNNGPVRCSQGTELCDAGLTVVSSTGPREKKSGLRTTLVSAESAEAGLEIHCLESASQSSHVADALPETPSVCMNTELEKLKATSADSPCEGKSYTHEVMHSEVVNSLELCSGVAERRPAGARAEETTFVHVKQDAMTDICHNEEQTMSSVLCTAVGTEIQTPVREHKQLAVADAARSTHTVGLVTAERENTKESNEPECLQSKSSGVAERQDRATLPEEEAELKVAAFCFVSISSGSHLFWGNTTTINSLSVSILTLLTPGHTSRLSNSNIEQFVKRSTAGC